MNSKILKSISIQVYKYFPELEGASPKVQPQTLSKSLAEPRNFLIVYRRTIKTDQGKSLQRIVRVVATSQGKILKMTTSR